MKPIPDGLAFTCDKVFSLFPFVSSKSVHLSQLPSISQGCNPLHCCLLFTEAWLNASVRESLSGGMMRREGTKSDHCEVYDTEY